MHLESFLLNTPIGHLQIFCSENKVVEINMGLDSKRRVKPREALELSAFTQYARQQLEAYFLNATASVDLETHVEGTNFQKSVWGIIKSIGCGETLTYSDIAQMLDSSPRAVGNACRANPVPIVVPCHRVVAKSGLGGFAGQRNGKNIDVKSWLLQHETPCLIA